MITAFLISASLLGQATVVGEAKMHKVLPAQFERIEIYRHQPVENHITSKFNDQAIRGITKVTRMSDQYTDDSWGTAVIKKTLQEKAAASRKAFDKACSDLEQSQQVTDKAQKLNLKTIKLADHENAIATAAKNKWKDAITTEIQVKDKLSNAKESDRPELGIKVKEAEKLVEVAAEAMNTANQDAAEKNELLKAANQALIDAKAWNKQAEATYQAAKTRAEADQAAADKAVQDAVDKDINTGEQKNVNEVFVASAFFSANKYDLLGKPYLADGLLIHEGMRLMADPTGHFKLKFQVETPQMPVVLRLQFVVNTIDVTGKPKTGSITLPAIEIPFDEKTEEDLKYPRLFVLEHNGYSSIFEDIRPGSTKIDRFGTASFGFDRAAPSK